MTHRVARQGIGQSRPLHPGRSHVERELRRDQAGGYGGEHWRQALPPDSREVVF
jgi:hypothetical protein